MKTFETEKHNIPEGATHYSEECVGKYFCWYAVTEDNAKICALDGRGVGYKWYKCTNEHYGCDVKPIPNTETTEWSNGDDLDWLKPNNRWCEFEHMFVGEKSNGHPVIEHKTTGNVFETYWSAIRKPESPQQKLERKRLESAYDLYCHVQSTQNQAAATFELFTKVQGIMSLHRERYLAIVDKTNYRKGE